MIINAMNSGANVFMVDFEDSTSPTWWNVIEGQVNALRAGEITEHDLARNIAVGLQYKAAWLRGNGCAPIDKLMENAATPEICGAQLSQWVRHGACLNDGRPVTAAREGTSGSAAGPAA